MDRNPMLSVIALLTLFTVNMAMAAPETPRTAPEATPPAQAAPQAEPMSLERLDRLIRGIDEKVQREGAQWRFTFAEHTLLAVADGQANRMRVMVPVTKADALTREALYRTLQADFDAALDARYAIANGLIWSVFLHPLGSLHDDDFLSGVAQVITAARTFGTTYSSGSLVFGGGDSNDEHRRLMEQLRQRVRQPGDI